MTPHLAWGHPVPRWAHLPVAACGVKVQQLKARLQTLFPERGPASGLLSCEAASAGSCHSEELLLDDIRVHRRDGAYTGRACGCPWPLAGKCPPIAVMWAEAREALRECPPAPQEDSRAPRLPSAPASQRSLQRSSMESSASEPPVPL